MIDKVTQDPAEQKEEQGSCALFWLDNPNELKYTERTTLACQEKILTVKLEKESVVTTGSKAEQAPHNDEMVRHNFDKASRLIQEKFNQTITPHQLEQYCSTKKFRDGHTFFEIKQPWTTDGPLPIPERSKKEMQSNLDEIDFDEEVGSRPNLLKRSLSF